MDLEHRIQSTKLLLGKWGRWARQNDSHLGYPSQSAEQSANTGGPGHVENEYPDNDIRDIDISIHQQPEHYKSLICMYFRDLRTYPEIKMILRSKFSVSTIKRDINIAINRVESVLQILP